MTTNQRLSRWCVWPSRQQKLSRLIFVGVWLGVALTAGLITLTSALPSRAADLNRQGSSPIQSPANLTSPALQAQRLITSQESISGSDIVLVFDISGSTEDQTSCHDCWVRTNYGPDYPNNGYFNPLPYNPNWATPGTGNQSIPASALCTQPPQPFTSGAFQYLTVEAELYSREVGDWRLETRVPGQGFFTLQRGSKVSGNNDLGEDNEQRNAAGNPSLQSSNVCNPNVAGNQIDCTVGAGVGDAVCSSADGGLAIDCSAYIAARPFAPYNQIPGSDPHLVGATYNADCFSSNTLSGACWSSNPFVSITGPGPSNVPWVEYDFTPTWTQTTFIWIRASGGGEQAYTWAGFNPDQLQPDLNGNGPANNLAPWRKVIYWQVENGTINQRKDNLNPDYQISPADTNGGHFQQATSWRDNRAENGLWRWIKLGSIPPISGTHTLKLYQGSAGYKVDKLVFTNDPAGSTPEAGPANPIIPAALRRRLNGTTAPNDGGEAVGPPASFGSASREACNVCNPAYGYTVSPNQCTCKRGPADSTNGGYGSGQGCTLVLTTTNQLQKEIQTGLYAGLQPLRSAQEAVKHFAQNLNPQCQQLGLVPFTSGADNTAAQSDPTRRAKLQCLNWAINHTAEGVTACYDTTLSTAPLSYTQVISAVEKQWPESGRDIASGLREGLEELGIDWDGAGGQTVNSDCTATSNDGSACNRAGVARSILVLLTEGTPNSNPGNCAPTNGRPDLWDGLVGTEDADFECAMYYAFLAAQHNVTLFTIGIGAGVNADLLAALATGVDPRGDQPDVPMFVGTGQFFAAAKPTDLDAIFEAILVQTPGCPQGAPNSGLYLPIIIK